MLTEDLSDAFHEATERPPFALDVRQATVRARRIRRRRRAGAGILTVLMLAAGGLGIGTLARDRHEAATISPAPLPPRATVDGVDVTWLPPGVTPVGAAHLGVVTLANDYGLVQEFAVAPSAGSATSAPYVSVVVRRGKAINLGGIQRTFRGAGISTVVHGRPGLIVQFGNPRNLPKPPQRFTPVFTLVWVERVAGVPVTLEVDGTAGTTLPQLRRMADGLILHAAPAPPLDRQAAQAQIRDAFARAFTGGRPPQVSLDAIDRGDQLKTAQATLGRLLPNTALSTRIKVRTITFYDADHARVDISLSYDYLGRPSEQDVRASAVRVGGVWKATQNSYCDAISVSNIPCP